MKTRHRNWIALIILLLLIPGSVALAYGTAMAPGVDFGDFGQKAYGYLQYIDQNLWSRDSLSDEETERAQAWILSTLAGFGYEDGQVSLQDFVFQGPYNEDYLSQNIIVTLPGTGNGQVIVGAHYDGRGSGDNGSGVAVLLEAAERLIAEPALPETVVFVFFGAEEQSMAGSDAYVDSMTDEDVSRTEFMVNIDAVLCGDYCYLYGGVPDFQSRTVTGLTAFHKVYSIAQRLGLDIRLEPWTFGNPAPGYIEPEHPSPATGDWSNHVSFRNRGMEYVYFEASNWDIPGPKNQYDGYGETAEAGRLMHTAGDTLANLEVLFPGRAFYHMQVFSLLLHAVLAGI